MAIVIRLDALGPLATPSRYRALAESHLGRYLVAFDLEAATPEALLQTTDDIRQARKFADHVEAHACWTQVDPQHPRRLDGKPNRPLTAYTVTLLPIDD